MSRAYGRENFKISRLELFPEVIQFILLYLAHGGSSFSDRNLVSVPVVPIIRQFFRRSIVHWKILKFNKHVDSGYKISHLVFLQHVKAKEHVHWLSLQYRKATEKRDFKISDWIWIYLEVRYSCSIWICAMCTLPEAEKTERKKVGTVRVGDVFVAPHTRKHLVQQT